MGNSIADAESKVAGNNASKYFYPLKDQPSNKYTSQYNQLILSFARLGGQIGSGVSDTEAGAYDKIKNTIALTPDADPSTYKFVVAHELAHFQQWKGYYENYDDPKIRNQKIDTFVQDLRDHNDQQSFFKVMFDKELVAQRFAIALAIEQNDQPALKKYLNDDYEVYRGLAISKFDIETILEQLWQDGIIKKSLKESKYKDLFYQEWTDHHHEIPGVTPVNRFNIDHFDPASTDSDFLEYSSPLFPDLQLHLDNNPFGVPDDGQPEPLVLQPSGAGNPFALRLFGPDVQPIPGEGAPLPNDGTGAPADFQPEGSLNPFNMHLLDDGLRLNNDWSNAPFDGQQTPVNPAIDPENPFRLSLGNNTFNVPFDPGDGQGAAFNPEAPANPFGLNLFHQNLQLNSDISNGTMLQPSGSTGGTSLFKSFSQTNAEPFEPNFVTNLGISPRPAPIPGMGPSLFHTSSMLLPIGGANTMTITPAESIRSTGEIANLEPSIAEPAELMGGIDNMAGGMGGFGGAGEMGGPPMGEAGGFGGAGMGGADEGMA